MDKIIWQVIQQAKALLDLSISYAFLASLSSTQWTICQIACKTWLICHHFCIINWKEGWFMEIASRKLRMCDWTSWFWTKFPTDNALLRCLVHVTSSSSSFFLYLFFMSIGFLEKYLKRMLDRADKSVMEFEDCLSYNTTFVSKVARVQKPITSLQGFNPRHKLTGPTLQDS